jgi:hypothetical protein
MVSNLNLENQKHVKFIIQVLGSTKKLRRNELFKKVQDIEEKIYGKRPFYQTINRDIKRLIDRGFIFIVDGGPRSQILSLSKDGKILFNKIKNKRNYEW